MRYAKSDRIRTFDFLSRSRSRASWRIRAAVAFCTVLTRRDKPYNVTDMRSMYSVSLKESIGRSEQVADYVLTATAIADKRPVRTNQLSGSWGRSRMRPLRAVLFFRGSHKYGWHRRWIGDVDLRAIRSGTADNISNDSNSAKTSWRGLCHRNNKNK